MFSQFAGLPPHFEWMNRLFKSGIKCTHYISASS